MSTKDGGVRPSKRGTSTTVGRAGPRDMSTNAGLPTPGWPVTSPTLEEIGVPGRTGVYADAAANAGTDTASTEVGQAAVTRCTRTPTDAGDSGQRGPVADPARDASNGYIRKGRSTNIRRSINRPRLKRRWPSRRILYLDVRTYRLG